jgi:hypothetical protein
MMLILILACGQSNSNKDTLQTNDVTLDDSILSLDTFSTFPPEIDGCSCCFSNDSTEYKKSHYIYMNDYAQTCFVKINGTLTKFVQIDFKENDSREIKAKYKNDSYEMTIESKEVIRNGDETWLQTGTIKVTNKKGKTIVKPFYGECGC